MKRLSHEHRANIGAALRGKPKSPEHRANLSASHKGQIISADHRAKLRDALLGRPISEERRLKMLGHPGYMLGKHHSEETKSKIGASTRGRKRPLEECAKISAALKGIKRSPETRAKVSAARAKQRFPFNNTGPELACQRWLRAHGVKFSTHLRIASHAFDIAVPSLRTLIEVDGCYWHRCPIHAPQSTRCPDIFKAESTATQLGWFVVHLWEHDIPLLTVGRGRS